MIRLRSICDIQSDQIDWILGRAAELRSGAPPTSLPLSSVVVGLAFFEASLRTRVGFAAASARLGATPIEVSAVRSHATSKPESIADTLRTLAGYSDVVVTRLDVPFTVPDGVTVPVVNGGDRGPAAEHPSQALIDMFAMQSVNHRVESLMIALCGDLRMRAARSLLLLLAQRPPSRLVLITEPELLDGFELPPQLRDCSEFRALDTMGPVDVLYVVGLPYGALEDDSRVRLRVTPGHLDQLSTQGVVLSPLPVIDEMEPEAVAHPAVRMFQQSDDGLYVRMALLEMVLIGR